MEDYNDIERLLDEGFANRTTGATAMNAQSSRSHSVFTLEVQQQTATSSITLIDLAVGIYESQCHVAGDTDWLLCACIRREARMSSQQLPPEPE